MIDNKKIILLGPPGSGKGTISKLLIKNFPNFKHLSSGDIFREVLKSNSPLSLKLKEVLESGGLVSDEITNEIVFNEIDKVLLEKKGFILDGYPRTIPQAKYLDSSINIDFVFLFSLEEEEIIKRIVSRRICLNCNAIYNLAFDETTPKNKSLCDSCNSILVQRKDDTYEVIKKRVDVYTKETKPLIEYYKNSNKLVVIDASLKPQVVYEQIINAIRKTDN